MIIINTGKVINFPFVSGIDWGPGRWFQLTDALSAFHLYGKTGRSGGTTNGTVLPTGNFSEKEE